MDILDGATFVYFMATGVTPAMEQKVVGLGSQYAWTAHDAVGPPLDGGSTYRLHPPKGIPVKDFWSAILFSNLARLIRTACRKAPSAIGRPGSAAPRRPGLALAA
ncbi:DUF1214 domain-containing protein [Rhodovulum sp.]|uniref:DUF1214 domain-containing protein n=1 Tax=Rhodovulum sp. TaxID=34009 RepID=UPI00257F3432|nr:DUF1214 domain-containing protein [Rhodovulum sp.]